MAAAKSTNSEILSQLRIDSATTKKDVKNIDEKLVALDKKFDEFTTNMKGYVPADIYRLNMEAQNKINEDTNKKIDDNNKAIIDRVKVLEDFNSINSGGIKFSNEIVANILKTVGYVAAAALIVLAGYIILKNGGSV